MLIVSPAMRLISASQVISTAGDAELQEPTVDLDRQFAGGFRVKTAPSYGAAGCQEGAPPGWNLVRSDITSKLNAVFTQRVNHCVVLGEQGGLARQERWGECRLSPKLNGVRR